jgi:hypothetical protein
MLLKLASFLLLSWHSLAATAVGPDGSIYVLGFGQDRIRATENAWIRTPPAAGWLARIDGSSGRTIFATYLPFFARSMAIDRRGAAVFMTIPESGSTQRDYPHRAGWLKTRGRDPVVL